MYKIRMHNSKLLHGVEPLHIPAVTLETRLFNAAIIRLWFGETTQFRCVTLRLSCGLHRNNATLVASACLYKPHS